MDQAIACLGAALEVDGTQDLEGTPGGRVPCVTHSQALRAPGGISLRTAAHGGCLGGRGSKGAAERAHQSLRAKGKRSARAQVPLGEGSFPAAFGVK